MNKQEVLEQEIKEANESYRAGFSSMLDINYDKLIDTLEKDYPTSELLKTGVIEKVSNREEKLPIPMYSLDKLKSFKQIVKWGETCGIDKDEILIITPKYDGISLVVNEINKRAWTRGDGERGQQSQFHYQKLRSNDEDLDCHSFGEAIMSKKNFEKYKEEKANPRNMVAGLFNRDITTEPLKDVDYIRYGLDLEIEKAAQLDICNLSNSVSVDYIFVSLDRLTEEKLEEIYQIFSRDYAIDGLVIDINSAEKRKELGREKNMNPKYAKAYKNPEWSSSAIVKVEGLTFKVSKNGKVKPVINIEPTEVAGVVISNVTGYNAKYIFDNNIAKDSIIKIVRSGDVIPKHIETLSFNKLEVEALMDDLTECPCCGSFIEWDNSLTELICSNPNCKDQKIGKIVHFFKTMEIEEFGEPSIVKFFDAGYTTPFRILTMTKGEMKDVEGWGEKSAIKLYNQFEELYQTPTSVAKFIDALDVMKGKLGEKTIRKILVTLSDAQLELCDSITVEELCEIEGIAKITAEIFIEGFKMAYESLDRYPIYLEMDKEKKVTLKGDKFKDEVICFTGCRPTKEQEKEIEDQGGQVGKSVSSKTTLLVVKEKSEKVMKSNKATKALLVGIKIIELKEL